jgi:16S rRNA (cytosine967-C5)-methyltransferase
VQISAALLSSATLALEQILPMSHPADAVLRQYFRENSQLGSRDRSFVAETVFCVIRHKRLLEHLLEHPSARKLALGALIKIQGIGLGQLDTLLQPEDKDWAVRLKATDIEALDAATRLSLPDWLYQSLSVQVSAANAMEFGRAMLNPAPLDLRVNTLVMTREKVLAELLSSGFEARATAFSPIGIRLTGKPPINRHALFLQGALEVQDEGSQLLGFLVAPKRREMVVDFCAGAGGKTLMLGAMMHSQGRLYALDISAKRLNNLRLRLKRSGLSNVHPEFIENENDTKIKRLAGKIDRVLVDSPCSGLGTLRRNPDLKWRQSPESVAELATKQRTILNAAAKLPKPGGRLAYATCSVLHEENQQIVSDFLATHEDFKLLNAGEVLDDSRIPLECGEFFELHPQTHGTDGFFAAVMEKNL